MFRTKELLMSLTLGLLTSQCLLSAESPLNYGITFTQTQIITSQLPGSTLPNLSGGTTPVIGGDGFGNAVSIDSLGSGNLLIAGQDVTANGVNDSGALSFYTSSPCSDGQLIQPALTFQPNMTYYTEFLEGDVPGSFNALKVMGNWAMCTVGAPVTGVPGPYQHVSGAVLVFQNVNNVWTLNQVLQPTDLSFGYDVNAAEATPPYSCVPSTYADEFGGQYPDFYIGNNTGWAFLGAPQQEINGIPLQGSVYVYQLNTQTNLWQFTQKITAPSSVSSTRLFNLAFGGASYINGNYAFITAEGNYDCSFYACNSGADVDNGYAFFYQLNTQTNQWQYVTTIRGNQGTPTTCKSDSFSVGDLFGFRINFNNNWAAIGAPLDNSFPTTAPFAGAVYLYTPQLKNGNIVGWNFVEKIFSDQPSAQGAFGTNLFLNNNLLYITDNRTITTPSGTLPYVGAVPVWQNNGNSWSQLTTLQNPTPHAFDFFGAALSVAGNTVVVGNNPNFGYYLPYIFVPEPSQYNNGKVVIFQQ